MLAGCCLGGGSFDRGCRFRLGRLSGCGDDADGLGGYNGGGRSRACDAGELFFQVGGGDFVKGAGWDLGIGDAEFLGFDEHFLTLETKFFCYIVNSDGHNRLLRALPRRRTLRTTHLIQW
jgi:hypothetical protein